MKENKVKKINIVDENELKDVAVDVHIMRSGYALNVDMLYI